VEDSGRRYFVRVGEDIPIHGVMRFNESAASRAAASCGLSPELLHQAPGALVFRYIEAKTLSAEDVRPRAMLERILPLLRICHREMPKHVRGPALIFWVFHVVRDYAHTLKEATAPISPTCRRFSAWRMNLNMRLVPSTSCSATTICCPATSSMTAGRSG
jgi:hypothetical protein